MSVIWQAITQVYAALAFMPFISFFVLWIVIYFITQNKKTSTRFSMDITFVLLIGSVSVLLHSLTGRNTFFWMVVFVLLLSAGLIGREQNRRNGRVDLVKLAAWVSRSGFLFLSFLYLVLVLIGVTRYILAG